MYTSNELESLSTAFDERMRQLENEVMEDIIRRIRINGEITRSADWQVNRLVELGMGRKEIENRIKKALNLSEEEVKKLYSDIIESGYARDAGLYKKSGIKKIPFEKNDVLQQLIAATAAQTANEMRNLSGSLGFAVRNADGTVHFTEIGKFYQDTVDNAINGIANGVFDYNTALKKAVSALTNSGLRTVDYASGWSNRVDVAARRSVMTGIAQLTGKINEQNAEELGTDTFEVTWHGGARPSHQVWQGRWYTKKQLVSVCGLGSVTGLCGANCYHDYYPVIPGISEPTYTEEQLREMNRKENIPVEYGGKQYTKYEALQHQRRLETKMRAQRQEIHLLEAGGASEDDIIAARCRYRVTSGEYTRFSKAMELPQQRERVTVDGLGNVGVGKWKKKVDISGESGIITLNRKSNNTGLFSGLKIPMQKRAVLRICEKYKIDTKGLTFKIQRSEDMLNIPYYGSTDYDNIGRIDLFPLAFTDEEQLLRSILHEKCHVEQLQIYGKEYVQKNLYEMEKQAYEYEEYQYRIMKKEVG